jgi:hypothetical protein
LSVGARGCATPPSRAACRGEYSAAALTRANSVRVADRDDAVEPAGVGGGVPQACPGARKLLAEAAAGSSLVDVERALLREVLSRSPDVVHWQNGNVTDDVALARAGAKSVVMEGLQRGRGPRGPTPHDSAGCRLPVPRRGAARPATGRRLRRPPLHRQGRVDLDARPDPLGPRHRPPAPTVRTSVHLRGTPHRAVVDLRRRPAPHPYRPRLLRARPRQRKPSNIRFRRRPSVPNSVGRKASTNPERSLHRP